jgi:hypothetical protein
MDFKGTGMTFPAASRARWLQMPGWLHALRTLAIALLMAGGAAAPCWAQPGSMADEYQIKAAFLYKFVSYVEWPPRSFPLPDSPLVIGVIGSDALADELASIVATRTAHGRRVVARKLRGDEPVAGLHTLFVGRLESTQTTEILASAREHAVLTVSESPASFSLGSVINFLVVDGKVRFEVALIPAEQAGLKISSRLLGVAHRVVSP